MCAAIGLLPWVRLGGIAAGCGSSGPVNLEWITVFNLDLALQYVALRVFVKVASVAAGIVIFDPKILVLPSGGDMLLPVGHSDAHYATVLFDKHLLKMKVISAPANNKHRQ